MIATGDLLRIRAVNSSLDDEADRQVYADWIEENGQLTSDHIMSLIVQHPADDGPRLLYALMKERAGESVEGEFIRAQVELARLSEVKARRCERCGCVGYELPLAQAGYGACASCKEIGVRSARLRSREQVLFRYSHISPGWLPDLWYPQLGFSQQYQDHMPIATYTRGFVSHVNCSWMDMVEHGDLLVKEQPVEYVQFTNWPQLQWFVQDMDRPRAVSYWLVPNRGHNMITSSELRGLASQVDSMRRTEIIYRKLLAKNWPTVSKWVLPEVEVHEAP